MIFYRTLVISTCKITTRTFFSRTRKIPRINTRTLPRHKTPIFLATFFSPSYGFYIFQCNFRFPLLLHYSCRHQPKDKRQDNPH